MPTVVLYVHRWARKEEGFDCFDHLMFAVLAGRRSAKRLDLRRAGILWGG